MKPLFLMMPIALVLAGCETPTDQSIATGALTGAAVGAIASDKGDKTKGAILGGAAGAAVGAIVSGANQPQCKFVYSDGTTRMGPCP